jgi:putative transposase
MDAYLYSSDLNDAEWALLAPLVRRSHPAGRRQIYPVRRIVDAIFYLLRTGAQWRLLPHEYPPRGAIFYHYAQWRENGTWEHVTQALRESYRRTIGRSPQPTAAIIDSQSVKTAEMGGPRGYDGGKKIKGRKRHLLVDTQGNLLKNSVHPAAIHDRAGAEILLSDLQPLFPAIRLVWADTADRGLRDWLQKALGWRLSIPQHWWTGGVWMRVGAEPPTRPSGFQVLARRWIVERTIAWLTTNRRLAKDYERFVETGEMLLYLAMSRILLRRLTSKRER